VHCAATHVGDSPTNTRTIVEETSKKAKASQDALAARIEKIDVDALKVRAESLGKGASVSAASPGFSGKQRRHVRGLGHPLKAQVQIGHHGLSNGLAGAILIALDQREVVKVKLLESAPCSMALAALWIHEATASSVVQILGRTLLVYRRHPKQPVVRLPSA
jgi:RNA-binding protein